jgi:aminomethyltransferase
MSFSKIHSRLLPKMGNFAGHNLPLRFGKFNSKDVVINTRKPGYTTVFDVSHMGIYESLNLSSFIGKKLEGLLYIDIDKLRENKAKLAVLMNDGDVLDDLIISNVDKRKYRLVVNADKKTTKFFDNFDRENIVKKQRSIIALQGEGSQKILETIIRAPLDRLYFMENKTIVKDRFEICRCGYTGEDGFELYLDESYGCEIYENLVSLADNYEKTSVQFGGLIERDVLRTEAGLCLSGAEFGDNLGIKFNSLNMPFLVDKKYRVDNSLKVRFRSELVKTMVVSNKPIQKGSLFVEDTKYKNEGNYEMKVGFITSAVKSFSLNRFIGIGYINREYRLDKVFTKDRRDRNNYLELKDSVIGLNYYRKSN